MGRCPRDGDGIVAFHLIEEDIDPGDDPLVGDRLDGPSGKEFHTVHAVGDDVVARGGVRRQVPAPLLDPVEGIVHCTKFAGVARGVPSAKPIRVGGGRGHGSPDRPGVVAAPGEVMWTPHPADPVGRAEPSVKRKAVGASNRGSPGPVDLAIYSSAFFRVENLFTSAGIPTV